MYSNLVSNPAAVYLSPNPRNGVLAFTELPPVFDLDSSGFEL